MTRVAIVGAHGKVGQYLCKLAYDRGDEALGIIRNRDHGEDLYRLGAESAIVDIESATARELADAIVGCDAIIFAAGAGAGSSAARKRTSDFGGSRLSAEAAKLAEVRRFIQVSAIGVDEPLDADADEIWAAYVHAKRDADTALRASHLDWTIVRPGGLTSEPGTGQITIGEHVERGTIPREDVAETIFAILDDPKTIGMSLDLVSGPTPIAEAIRELS